MKKIVVMMMLSVLAFGSTKANPVTPATARQVAETWMQAMGMRNTSVLVDVTSSTPFTEFYLFAAPDSGFILVSGDDCALPVIGYSLENSFPSKDIPQHVLSLLTGYEEEIRWCRQHPDDILDTVARQWQLLTHGQMPKAVFDHGVMPLMKARWGQGAPYNGLCPQYDDTSRCAVGCVALAMAQIMEYWHYPERGYDSYTYNSTFGTLSADFGATTYDWDHMPYRLSTASSDEEVEAVARLQYHCGVAMEMNYGHSSSSNSLKAIAAMCHYFKYSAAMAIVQRSDMADSDYCALWCSELEAGRPLYVDGRMSNGINHAFNCDGFSPLNYFHFLIGTNGWGDGYYTLSSIMTFADRVPYIVNREAVVGIQPHPGWDSSAYTLVTASVSDVVSATGASASVLGTGSYPFGSTVTLTVGDVPDGYRFARWSDGCSDNPRQLFANGGTFHFSALLEPLTGDTLSYCGTRSAYWGINVGDPARWGIYLPAVLFGGGDTITAVEIYTLHAGDYTMNLYAGLNAAAPPLYSATSHFDNEGWTEAQWHTIPLGSLLTIDSLHGLLITFEYGGDGQHPAAATRRYGGTRYASLHGDGFGSYDDRFSWMIRAIFGSHQPDTIDNLCGSSFSVPYYLGYDSILFSEYARCWTTLDADGDGRDWYLYAPSFVSYSWINDTALTPDNWLISPAIDLPEIPCMLSWSEYVSINYPNEHYGLYISTTGTDTADFTLLTEYTGDTSGLWVRHEMPLDDWSGNTVHVAFRHFNSTDQSRLLIASVDILAQQDKSIDVYSNNSSWGSVTGSGSYPYGSSVTVEAIPFNGSTFQGWSNGVTDNPYTLTLTSDTLLTALFYNPNGIDELESNGINISVDNGRIIVEGAEGETVQVYDMEGRQLNTEHTTLHPGIYMVKVGNRAAQKVIVIQ